MAVRLAAGNRRNGRVLLQVAQKPLKSAPLFSRKSYAPPPHSRDRPLHRRQHLAPPHQYDAGTQRRHPRHLHRRFRRYPLYQPSGRCPSHRRHRLCRRRALFHPRRRHRAWHYHHRAGRPCHRQWRPPPRGALRLGHFHLQLPPAEPACRPRLVRARSHPRRPRRPWRYPALCRRLPRHYPRRHAALGAGQLRHFNPLCPWQCAPGDAGQPERDRDASRP